MYIDAAGEKLIADNFDNDLQPGQERRFKQQIEFVLEIDKLKHVLRKTILMDQSRRENSAEHSWHLTLFALTLAPEAPPEVSIERVIRMLILHDLVEIDAGDTPIHGAGDAAKVARAEQAAADRIFGLLPDDQGLDFRALWDEFEAACSPDAIFAKALDRFQPPTLNLANGGGSWIDYGVTEDQVRARVGTPIERGAPSLWAWIAPKISAFFSR